MSSAQRGSVQYLFQYPGDPLTPGKPAIPGVPRLKMEEATDLHAHSRATDFLW